MATVSLLLNRDKLCAAENPKLVETEGAGYRAQANFLCLRPFS